MVREPPVSGDPVGAAKRARCERAGALRLLGDDSSAAGELAPEALTTPSAPGRARENLPLGRLLPTRPFYLAQWSQGLSNPRVLSPPHRMARLGSHTYPSGKASAELISSTTRLTNAPTECDRDAPNTWVRLDARSLIRKGTSAKRKDGF